MAYAGDLKSIRAVLHRRASQSKMAKTASVYAASWSVAPGIAAQPRDPNRKANRHHYRHLEYSEPFQFRHPRHHQSGAMKIFLGTPTHPVQVVELFGVLLPHENGVCLSIRVHCRQRMTHATNLHDLPPQETSGD